MLNVKVSLSNTISSKEVVDSRGISLCVESYPCNSSKLNTIKPFNKNSQLSTSRCQKIQNFQNIRHVDNKKKTIDSQKEIVFAIFILHVITFIVSWDSCLQPHSWWCEKEYIKVVALLGLTSSKVNFGSKNRL
jgi:hypothetical protein